MVDKPSVSPDAPMNNLMAAFGPSLEIDKDLAPLTSFKVGGKAKLFLSATKAAEVAAAVVGARKDSIPFFVLGGGSNLLVSDSGYDGLIIKVDIRGMKLISDTEIECGGGEDLSSLVDFATSNSLTGMEFAAGIWGSVGGAVCGNAGAFGSETSAVVSQVTLVDTDGNIKTVSSEDCQFSYRHSVLKSTGEVVASVSFKLSKGDKKAIQARVTEILSHREARHPVDGMSAGCFFKNITDPDQPQGKISAGKLLDAAGAKGLSVGDAKVYDGHANIIVNSGNATAKDIRKLADIMKQKVLDKFGIELEEEAVQVGEI